MTDSVVAGARAARLAPNTSDSKPALVHLAVDARAAGVSVYHGSWPQRGRFQRSGSAPVSGSHIFTRPGSCKAAIDAELKGGKRG